MEFRVLGPLEVLAEGQGRDLGGQKQRSLLAVLLLEANRVVSSDRLIEALWEEEPPETAQKALQVYVSQLRKLLGRERLETRPSGYLLRVEEGELDLDRFEHLRGQGRLAEALSLWRGPPLSDFRYQRFAQSEIARLEEVRLACLEDRIEVDLAAGRHGELVGELEALVREHPLRQRLRGQLMLALYRSGRDAEALEAYKEGRRLLVEDLGIEPRRELRELQQAILNQDPALDLAAGKTAVPDSSRGAFVGRDRELGELLAGLDAALAGHGRLFLLVGEPGIGKSRLADELINQARARGARVLIGRCWEAGGAPAYWPWVQSLRACIRETEPEALRALLGTGAPELAQLLPELRELFPELPEPPALESEGARFRMFETVSSYLASAAQPRPLVLVLDDLQAADAPSLLLLQFLTRRLDSTRMLVLGAYRDVDPLPGQALTAMLAEVIREPATRRISLRGLSETDVREYVELAASEMASQELVASLHEETEGNPFFLGEIVRLLALEAGRSESTAEVQLAIPQSIRDVIARRLSHLSEECNRLLILASVLGREFALVALARLAGVPENELLETLDEAMAARVVSDLPGAHGRLRFAHVLIRDTLYDGLTTARRVRLHRLAIEALEALYGEEPGAHLAELAYHSFAGSDLEKALLHARRAGHRALALLAYEEAARLYRLALDALELSVPENDMTRCELVLSLGEAEVRAGNGPAAKKAFLDAADIARRLGLAHELARAVAGYGGRIPWARAGDDELLVPLLEEGLTALADDDVELRARLLARLAGALRDERLRDRRDRLSGEAVQLAHRTGNPAALAYALDGRGSAIIAPDTVDECLALATELCEVGKRVDDRERVAHGHFLRFVAEVMVGDLAEAELDLDADSRVADELRQPSQLWQVRSARAMLAVATGRLTAADELVPQALALGERAQPELAIPAYWLQRYTLSELRGTLEEVERGIRKLVADYPARVVFRSVLAHLQAKLGRRDDAEEELKELGRDDFSALNFDLEWLLAMSLLAETAWILGDAESAATQYRLLAPWKRLNVADTPEAIRGSVSRYLGLLAVTIERRDEAASHFEHAVEANERMGLLPWLAHTKSDYARMLIERGEAKRASELVAAAIATYRELGMESYAAKSLTLAQNVSATVRRP
jgi:eukaryotic-like serine/threonine-protein kinase